VLHLGLNIFDAPAPHAQISRCSYPDVHLTWIAGILREVLV
jgi:hypothetical protein